MNDVLTSSCIIPSSMDGTDKGGSGWSSGVEKVKEICCREDDDENSSDGSLIRKCGSSEICLPHVHTPLPLVRTPLPLVHTPPPLIRTQPPLVCTPPPLVRTLSPLITTFSYDDCLSVSTTLGRISNLSTSCIASKVVVHN